MHVSSSSKGAMSRGKKVKNCTTDRSYIDDEKSLSYPCGGGHGGMGVWIWMMVGCEWKELERRHDTTVWEKLREAGIVRVKGVMDEDARCGLLVVVFFFFVYLGEGSWHC
jgi:hypothetical protein